MGKYLHKFDAVSDFEDAYYGEDYHEPWVSYTEEKTTGNIVTAFTCDNTDFDGQDISGVFTFYGPVYRYNILSEYDEETGNNVAKGYEQSTTFYYLWTNGTNFLGTSSRNPESGNEIGFAYGFKTDDLDGQWVPWRPSSNIILTVIPYNGTKISSVETTEVEIPDVFYNKPALYITWDGTYDTTTYSGVSIPNYVVDNVRSHVDIFNDNFLVYVNDVLDDRWFFGKKQIARHNNCTFSKVIYKSDADGLLYVGDTRACYEW